MHRLRCVLIIFILTTFTQTPRDMSFIPKRYLHVFYDPYKTYIYIELTK